MAMKQNERPLNPIPDPIAQGLARGWRVLGGADRPLPAELRCDVAIVGSGAGGGITAELLTAAGLDVVVIEEGPLRSSRDFQQNEAQAYPQLYQESAARKTADKAISILQGRCVGGSTTVNWTSSFRTPGATLAYWQQRFELPELGEQAMAPWFAQVEQRLNIGPWLAPPNVNNQLLREGAARLGIPAAAILRNVKGCWNLGSCGMGCPTNAKQSMLVTCLPAALDRGARLLVNSRAERLLLGPAGVRGVQVQAVALNGQPLKQPPCQVLARHVVVAGGAINSPALLLRSGVPDPHQRLGRRTFLHPVVVSSGAFDTPVQGWMGAPQTIYTDHFLETQPIDGPMGFKLEAPPLHPLIVGSTLPGHGPQQAALLRNLPNTHALLALMRDGFHAESPGGQVRLRADGSPALHYPLNDFFFEAARRALLHMAEIQFAAGAREVLPVHELGRPCHSWAQAQAHIAELPMRPLLTRVLSAHVMGGCGMAGRPELGVVRPDGQHWQVAGLSVHDGSIFPTSIGANPQLSVYGLAARLATGLARQLTGRQVRLGG
jgi:choline dehydrogenase-like flavoprotein